MDMIESIRANHTLNADEIAKQRAERFARSDRDGDGILTTEEIDAFIDNISEKKDVAMDRERFAAALDKDGNGEVTAEEFEAMQRPGSSPHFPKFRNGIWAKENGRHPNERFFDKLDTDLSGDISESELTEFLTRVSERTGKEFNPEDVMARLDSNEDGTVGKEELRGMRRIMGPPPHRGAPPHRGSHPLDAGRIYAETVDAEADEQNAPPTIVVPV
jgi:Ca2+-binding EF-hand superfamily protein